MWFGAYVRFGRIVKSRSESWWFPLVSMRYQPFRTVMARVALFPAELHRLIRTDDPEPGLRAVLADPVFLEALWVASPSLAADAELLTGKPDELSAKRRRATIAALTRYVIRASSRATPFGAFAGVAAADWGDELSCVIDAPRQHHRVARLDHGAAMRFARNAERDPGARRGLRVFANPAAFVLGGRLTLPYRLPSDGDTDIGEQVSVRLTAPLVHAVRETQQPMGFADLGASMARAYPDRTPAQIEEFLGTLLDQEVLLSTARPPLTPDDPAVAVSGIPAATELISAIADYRARPLGAGRDALRAVYALDDTTGRGRSQRSVQVDVAFAGRATVPRELVGELDTALAVLARLGPTPPDLTGYATEFAERYGAEPVPLLELLDPFTGLGAPAGYHNPPSTRATVERTGRRADRDEFLGRLIDDALRTGAHTVQLDPEHVVDSVAAPDGAPAESLDFFLQLGQSRSGEWLAVLGGTAGALSPAGRAFGRFSHLDRRLADVVAEAAEAERVNHPGLAFAGLSYAHARGHVNNVGIVPPVHDWRITVGTSAGVPAEEQLHLADVQVFLGPNGLALTATGLDRELVVRAPNLLNPTEAPNAVRFALALGMARGWPAEWSWGPFGALPFLPRVQVGRVVLTPARWRLPHPGLPRFVHAGRFDNRLLLDLDHATHRDLLAQERERGAEFVTEALPAPADAPAQGPTGRHVLELVVPLRLAEPPARRAAAVPAPRSPGVRLVLPGEDWTYAKLYGPAALREQVLRLLHTALAGHEWFFVRYADPLPHLRVRVHDNAALPTILTALRATVARGLIGRYALEGYERELDRYGGAAGFAVAERIFCADTRALLARPSTEPADDLGAAVGIEEFLAGLGIDAATRRAVYGRLVRGYAVEHAGDPAVRPARLARIFQRHRPELRALITEGARPPRTGLGAEFRALQLADPVDVLGSLTHLHANRAGLTRIAEHRAVWLVDRAHHDVEGMTGHVR